MFFDIINNNCILHYGIINIHCLLYHSTKREKIKKKSTIRNKIPNGNFPSKDDPSLFLFSSREGTNLPYLSNLFITRAKRFQSKNVILDAKKGSFRHDQTNDYTRPALITLPMVFQFRIGEDGGENGERIFAKPFFRPDFCRRI